MAWTLLPAICGQSTHDNSAKPPEAARISYVSSAVTSFSMSDDMQYAACGREDDFAFVWKLNPVILLRHYDLDSYQSLGSEGIPSLFLSTPSNVLKLVCGDGSTATFSIPDGKLVSQRRSSATSNLPFAQVLSSGQQLAIGTDAGAITITDFSDGQEKWSWQLPGALDAKLVGASLSPKGRLLATEDRNGNIRLLDTQSRQMIASTNGNLDLHPLQAGSDFSQDESRFICKGNDAGLILFWSKQQGSHFHEIETEVNHDQIALSPNGRLLAVSEQAGYAEIWGIDANGVVKRDLYTLGTVPEGRDLGHMTTCMAFSPDSRALLLGYRDGSVLLWKFEEGKSIELKTSGK
jgi:WD40 repeat protein